MSAWKCRLDERRGWPPDPPSVLPVAVVWHAARRPRGHGTRRSAASPVRRSAFGRWSRGRSGCRGRDRSWCDRPVRPPRDRASRCAWTPPSLAARNVGNWQMPSILRGLIGCSASSSAAEKASVPSDPTSRRARLSRPEARAAGVSASMLWSRRRGATGRESGRRFPRPRSRQETARALDQVGDARRHVGTEIVRDRAEAVARAVGQDGVDGADVVCHRAVADRLPGRRNCCRPCRR